jgi:hypothetical protein
MSGFVALVPLVLLALMPGAARAQPAASVDPVVCRVGVNLEDLYDFDPARETFGATLWLWTLCPSADPAPLATIAFRTALPGLELGDVRSTPVGDGRLYQYRRVQGTFRHDWDMSRYPFDRQRLVIPFDESDLGAGAVIFEADIESSALAPELPPRLHGWQISALAVRASVAPEATVDGWPGKASLGYARLEADVDLQRTSGFLAFIKVTLGVFAAALIAVLILFLDPRDKGTFSTKLFLLVSVLFAVLLNLRAADALFGDVARPTLITDIHLVVVVLIVAMALLALRERQRLERDLPIRHPDLPLLAVTAGLYVLINAGLIARAAWG